MKKYGWIIGIATLVLIYSLAQVLVVRWDMTDDQRYTLSPQTKQLLSTTEKPIEITIYLSGDLNAGFRRLQNAVKQLVEELGIYAEVHYHLFDSQETEYPQSLSPIVIHERERGGKTIQTWVYPYASIAYGERSRIVNLLKNNLGKSGEENLNASIESLEYIFAEAIHGLLQKDTPRVAFIEGHGELPEEEVYDVSAALSRYFYVDRGVLGEDPHVLDDYKVVIVADPQGEFTDKDKFILDQYLMRGGKILWLLNGVQLSEQVLSEEGYTPVLPLDLNLSDMLFRYGVRIDAALLQDAQCLPIPVNVSPDPYQTNLQTIPWYYAPLLLTSQVSPITKDLPQVSSMFVSPIEIVGGNDGIRKEVLLATSTSTRVVPTPAQVDLMEFNIDAAQFTYQFLPVAYALEGEFNSFFTHRMVPDGIISTEPIRTKSVRTRQVVVASGSIIRNETYQGEPLPAGYDRYSGMQFGNRDFIINAVLYLSDDEGLIDLRDKTLALRLLNDKKAYAQRLQIQVLSVLSPILSLVIIGLACTYIRRRRYTKTIIGKVE